MPAAPYPLPVFDFGFFDWDYGIVAANILYASTRCIGDKVYGNMLLGLPSDEGVVKEATAYLSRKENVLVQEVTKDVQ